MTTPAGRGSILDRSGVQLAIGEQDTTVYADPHMVIDARSVALAAQHLLGADANKLYPKLLRKNTRFVYVARFADPKAANAFLAKHFTGIGSYPEERRAYPQNTVAAPVIGYAGIDNKGLGGLELQYDHKLAGRPGSRRSSATRRARRSTRSARRRSARARTSSRRSTAASRRTPRRCSGRP